MYSSDSQAMGRVGETFTRLFQTADKMKRTTGPLPEDSARNDNRRILRYLAKLTINPALAHGISRYVGSLQPGRLADIVLWSPQFFAAKPKLVIKGGMIVWSAMGDPNASIPTCEPVFYRPMFGAFAGALLHTSLTFVSRAALEAGAGPRLGLQRALAPVAGCRTVGKASMVLNDAMPRIDVDPETYEVRLDGELAESPPATSLALAQRYFVV
jgi:urease subunit alpha